MKVLVLNGSPRRGGAVSQMLDRIVENLGEACEVEYVFVGELAMKPCTGCMRCRSDLKCVLPEDDAHRIAQAVREADALVVGSPCYWGNMNGWLKVLFDRIVYAMMGEKPDGRPVPLHKGKRAVLVTSCNTIWPFSVWFRQTGGVVRALGEVLRWSGFRVVGTVAKSGSRRRAALSAREVRKCGKLAEKIRQS